MAVRSLTTMLTLFIHWMSVARWFASRSHPRRKPAPPQITATRPFNLEELRSLERIEKPLAENRGSGTGGLPWDPTTYRRKMATCGVHTST